MASFRILSFASVAALLLVTSAARPLNQKCIISIASDTGKQVALNAEIAITDEEKQKGLMFRKTLKDSEGMLFVFDKEQRLNFWMKNTYLPLDIAYIDKNGIINEIYQMKPLDVSVTYPSNKSAKYALEVNLGWFTRNRIKPGSKILLNGCLGKQNSLIKR